MMTASFHAVGIEIYHHKDRKNEKMSYQIGLRTDNELQLIVKDVEIQDDTEYEFIIQAFKPYIIEHAEFDDSDFKYLVSVSV